MGRTEIILVLYIASFYDIDERTISRYIEQHNKELRDNGYEVLSGARLRAFKDVYTQYVSDEVDGKDTDVPTNDEDDKDNAEDVDYEEDDNDNDNEMK